MCLPMKVELVPACSGGIEKGFRGCPALALVWGPVRARGKVFASDQASSVPCSAAGLGLQPACKAQPHGLRSPVPPLQQGQQCLRELVGIFVFYSCWVCCPPLL